MAKQHSDGAWVYVPGYRAPSRVATCLAAAGDSIITGSTDGSVVITGGFRVVNGEDGIRVDASSVVLWAEAQVLAVALHRRTALAAVGGEVHLYTVPDSAVCGKLAGAHRAPIELLATNEVAPRAASADGAGVVACWSLTPTPRLTHKLVVPGGVPHSLSIASDGVAAVGTPDSIWAFEGPENKEARDEPEEQPSLPRATKLCSNQLFHKDVPISGFAAGVHRDRAVLVVGSASGDVCQLRLPFAKE